ncbi:hypothetical protein SAMN04487866_12623 [Thermoactinomyces sp. DSM 45891]|uniref:hypothetical protein n=1 Tax=Thermoactinomyces sp. DSM 45891 TaxID=1761907 RepID=UPI000921A854|nr:hypothetical protein [Thermoactinomyces sp. DSM 45891]SFX79499.1 hypothetical protein SAMN04487866_12623 [Thermoactinomyces sp. DSM 45891]
MSNEMKRMTIRDQSGEERLTRYRAKLERRQNFILSLMMIAVFYFGVMHGLWKI